MAYDTDQSQYQPTEKKSSWGDWWWGRNEHQIPNYTPQQQQTQQTLLQQLEPLLKGLLSPQSGNFQDIAKAETLRHRQETIPSLAERLSGMGGGLSSSGFQDAMSRADTGFGLNLASMGAQYGLQQRGQNLDILRSLLSGGMSPAFSYVGSQPGISQQILPAAATMTGAYFGGPAGAQMGSQMTSGGMGGRGGTGGQGNNFIQYTGGQTNDWLNNILKNQGMNSRDFFSNSGIARG